MRWHAAGEGSLRREWDGDNGRAACAREAGPGPGDTRAQCQPQLNPPSGLISVARQPSPSEVGVCFETSLTPPD